jgi:hypothetical protein
MTVSKTILNYNLIEKASEKYENLKEVVVKMEIDGRIQEFVVEIYKHFSPVQIKMCVRELVEKLDYVKVKSNGDVNSMTVPYMIFLVIKHFTTLELPNTFAEQLKAIEHMTNTGTMFQIFIAFEQDELNKVLEEVNFIVDNFNGNMKEVEDFKSQIKETLKDKSLLE